MPRFLWPCWCGSDDERAPSEAVSRGAVEVQRSGAARWRSGRAAQLGARGGGPGPSARGAVNDTERWACRTSARRCTGSSAPRPSLHADLAAAPPCRGARAARRGAGRASHSAARQPAWNTRPLQLLAPSSSIDSCGFSGSGLVLFHSSRPRSWRDTSRTS